MSDKTIVIDGSFGEGGGQILRTALGLSAAFSFPVRIVNIRANRPKPGLAAQHLTAARAAAAICNGKLAGDRLGSTEIEFIPGEFVNGQHRFDIGTAGSTVLIAQTLIPALMVSGGRNTITVTGGTHNPMAPCFEYLRDVFGVLANAANLRAYFELQRAGFYPGGGGKLLLEVEGLNGADEIAPLRMTTRGHLRYIEGISAASSRLPGHIIERQTAQAMGLLASAGHKATIEQAVWDSATPGTVVFLRAIFARSVAGFFALGEKGKPAEEVARQAVEQLLAFLASPGVVDSHAADQFVTILGMCGDQSTLVTDRISDHLLTNAHVVEQMTGRKISIDGQAGKPGKVIIGAM